VAKNRAKPRRVGQAWRERAAGAMRDPTASYVFPDADENVYEAFTEHHALLDAERWNAREWWGYLKGSAV
jgi:hypothetical protein